MCASSSRPVDIRLQRGKKTTRGITTTFTDGTFATDSHKQGRTLKKKKKTDNPLLVRTRTIRDPDREGYTKTR